LILEHLKYKKISEEDSINIESVEQGTNLYQDFFVYKDEETYTFSKIQYKQYAFKCLLKNSDLNGV